MKVFSDEELQKLLESGKSLPENASQSDYQTYQYIFQALKAEPDFELDDNFSDTLVTMVEKRVAYSRNIHYYLLLAAVSLFALILGIIVVAVVNKSLVINLLNFIWAERWIVFSCMLLFLMIQIGDKLIKKFMLQNAHPFR